MDTEGARLKKIRLEKGFSLEEVQKKTKIHLNILKALEGDGFTDLSPVYLKGFLKIYCKFLGLNAPLSQEINVIAARSEPDKPGEPKTFLENAAVKLTTLGASRKRVKAIFILLLIIMFVTLGLFNIGKFISSRRTIPEKKEIKEKQAVRKTEAQTTVPKAIPKQIPLQKEARSGIRLIIRARENCWVYLKVDGRVVFQRVLEKGRSESWQAKERIELSLGNAGAVELQVNDQLFSNLGRKGQVRKNILITREGLNIDR